VAPAASSARRSSGSKSEVVGKRDGRKVLLDVRAKLLVMLAVLSLPLFIVSLIQLRGYRQSTYEQATTIVDLKSVAAAASLDSWLESHPDALRAGAQLDPQHTAELYARLRQQASSDDDSTFVVFDARGVPLPNPATPQVAPTNNISNVAPNVSPDAQNSSHVSREPSPDAGEQTWGDGVSRLTAARRGDEGWSVAVGVPLPQETRAGRSVLVVAATWAFALIASVVLSVWAVGRFTKPLRKLASSASTLGEGRLHERVAVETDDDVGTLAEGFNTMATRLEGKFKELRSQGAFIAEVLDSLPLGVVVLDANLVVRRANSAFARYVERDAASLEGRGLYEASAGLATLNELIEDVRRTRRAFVNYGLPLELVARRSDRQQETVDAREKPREEPPKFWDVTLYPTNDAAGETGASGDVRGDLILILSEVSKRVRAEKLATAAFAAEKSRAAELESVINQMDEGVVIVDARGRYRVNPSAARILAREPGEFRDGLDALIADMGLRDTQGQPLPAEETPLGRAFLRGEHVTGEHLQIARGDDKGGEGIVEVSATPLADDAGERAGLVAVFRDITDNVRQYRELIEAYGRLREHDRLKSAFVANVSHELRTPLNVIIGLCQLLERDVKTPLAPLQTEAVMRMERNARAQLELVNHLLEYSRLEAGRAALALEQVDVGALLNDAVADFAREAREKRITVRAVVAPELGRVRTDRNKLTQVVSNLLSNAVKFTATGEVSVTAEPVDADRWSLEVRDTGIGISREAIDFIFDEFRQVDDRLARSYSGVGLGLAITRKIVELLEGEIEVESRPNAGSRFRITLPRATRQRTGTGSLVREDAPRPPTRDDAQQSDVDQSLRACARR
jgi:signal transduction histidine kinase